MTAGPATVSPAPVRLEARALAHRYGARVGLEPLDFALDSPGIVAITGPNGCGKSTLLKAVAGLLRPSAGQLLVRIGGRELPAIARRAHVGLASPELAFYDEFTAAENLRFVAEVRGLPDPAAAIRDALSEVGLAERAGDAVAGFSSGMRQRLRLAFAVMHRPALLLLDEPGSHMDDGGRALVRRLLERWRTQALVLLATNDPEEIPLAGSRIELRGRRLGDPS